jgi:type II secretory pathway pseudopilin PulG
MPFLRTGSHRRAIDARGFSMVELLVVLSIVMVLTGLLMPGITRARHGAYRLMCASNLRQIGVAFMLHGEDHSGLLPDSYMQETGKIADMTAINTGTTNDPKRSPGYDGLGILWRDRYVESPRCFYCPAHHHEHTFESHAPYYDSLTGDFSRQVYSNYHFTGPCRFDDSGQLVPGGFRNINRLGRRLLVTDSLRSVEDFNHEDGINVLYSDTSTFWESDTASRIRRSLPDEAMLEGTSEAGGSWVIDIWNTLDLDGID